MYGCRNKNLLGRFLCFDFVNDQEVVCVFDYACSGDENDVITRHQDALLLTPRNDFVYQILRIV